MIKAIIFDWGDTLAPATLEKYFPAQKVKRKFKLDQASIEQCEKMVKETEPPSIPDNLKEEKRFFGKFWTLVAKEIEVEDRDRFVDFLLKWTFKEYTPTLFPEILETVRHLSRQKYHLAILSNGWPDRLLEIKRSKIGRYFEIILVSTIIGARKPEIKAYQIALRKIGFPPEQVLMIDNKEHYLVPAERLGMKVIYMDRIDFNPDSKFPRIKNISEILAYLKT